MVAKHVYYTGLAAIYKATQLKLKIHAPLQMCPNGFPWANPKLNLFPSLKKNWIKTPKKCIGMLIGSMKPNVELLFKKAIGKTFMHRLLWEAAYRQANPTHYLNSASVLHLRQPAQMPPSVSGEVQVPSVMFQWFEASVLIQQPLPAISNALDRHL